MSDHAGCGNRFDGRVAVVIGGNSGIGLATAIAFAREGAKVVITGRNEETLATAAAQIGPGTLAIRSDTARLDEIDRLMTRVEAECGRIDTLFVNAGIGTFLPFENVREQDWDQLFSVNLKGAYFSIQKAVPLMRRGASIVLNCSVGSRTGRPFNAVSVYSATKAGLRSLARTLGAELVGRGIRINCVSPGPIETPIADRVEGVSAERLAELRMLMIDSVPMKRMGHSEEVARAVLFLASDDASFITGVDLLVDGGMLSF